MAEKGGKLTDYRNDILKKRFDVGDIPARCSQHQCVKGVAVDFDDKSRRCICCNNYTLSLKSQTCQDCLATQHLDNFVVDRFLKDERWYAIYKGSAENG